MHIHNIIPSLENFTSMPSGLFQSPSTRSTVTVGDTPLLPATAAVAERFLVDIAAASSLLPTLVDALLA